MHCAWEHKCKWNYNIHTFATSFEAAMMKISFVRSYFSPCYLSLKIITNTKLWTNFTLSFPIVLCLIFKQKGWEIFFIFISSLNYLFQYISWNVKWGPEARLDLAPKWKLQVNSETTFGNSVGGGQGWNPSTLSCVTTESDTAVWVGVIYHQIHTK